MSALLIIFSLFVLQDEFVCAGLTKHCLCPQYTDTDRLVGFCGHEIIEKRASAKPSTRNCVPRFVYLCDEGPNKSAYEVRCRGENSACIPGSEAYQALTGNVSRDHGDSLLRHCASSEGKINYYFLP